MRDPLLEQIDILQSAVDRLRAEVRRRGGDHSGDAAEKVLALAAVPTTSGLCFVDETGNRRRVSLVAPQPAPKRAEGPALWPLVIADMQERDAAVRRKYGVPLQAHNGRDALVDAYREVLDQAVYLRQEIEERAARAKKCEELAARLDSYEAAQAALRDHYCAHCVGVDGDERICPTRKRLVSDVEHFAISPRDVLEALS